MNFRLRKLSLRKRSVEKKFISSTSILGEENFILFFTFASCGSSVNEFSIHFSIQ